MFSPEAFTFPDDKFSVSAALVRDLTFDCRKGFPHLADLSSLMPVLLPQFVVL